MKPQLDAHYAPRPAAEQRLGFNCHVQSITALDLARKCGATVVRGGGSWETLEDPITGRLEVPEGLRIGWEHCADIGLMPMPVAAYGSPFAPLKDTIGEKLLVLTTAQPVKAGDRTLTFTTAVPSMPTVASANLFLCGKNGAPLVHEGGGSLNRASNAGALIERYGWNTITLAAAVASDHPAGLRLVVNRYKYAPPASRLLTNPSRMAYSRYVRFLAEELAKHDGGQICIMNEAGSWPDNWLDLRRSYDDPPEDVSGGAMHTLLAQLIKETQGLPASVRLISGATDTAGGSMGLLKQYQPEVEGNRGPNYISQPTPEELRIFAGEGIHPYGGHQPEASCWDDSFNYLNPREGESKFVEVAQRQRTWGNAHGYDLQTLATECGGTAVYGEDKQARYLLRRVLSLWMSGVPLACIYNLGNGPFSVVHEEPDGVMYPREAFVALQRLMGLMVSCGPSGSVSALRVVGTLGNQYPMISGAFTGEDRQVLFIWQRSWSEGSGSEGWYPLASPSPATVTVGTGRVPSALNVRTGQPVSLTNVGLHQWSLPVADDPVAFVV